MNRSPRIWPVFIVAAIGIAILCGLGVWQLERLAWKQGLLADIARRGEATPVSLAEALKRHAAGEDIEYLKVEARGRYLTASEKHLISVFDGGLGWEVVSPLMTDDRHVLLVDRGVVPDNLRDPASRRETGSEDNVEARGILRAHDMPRGAFSPDNDVKANQWFWWDVPGMLAATPMPEGATPMPFVLQLAPAPGDKSFPRPQPIDAGLRNNHLQYAITWFALAIVLLVIASLYVRGQMKKTGA